MGKSYYYVEVETIQGESLIFQLPNDLQAAMRAYRHENPETWETLLKEALINIPSSSYTKANHYQPIIRLAKVKRSFSLKKQQRRRSRGQFLTRDNWEQKGLSHFSDNLRSIQHDYPFKIKVRLMFDFWCWKWRST
ncbi:hypothetical protein DIX60_10505 [Streptococcus iniae]|uniref:Uncharacterized protein n=1 Tax=Streptococcus didelphis TaxID=102886 RepID=A0ABY9LIM6_9STRE|nr:MULTISPECIES: hypothetical protein [Streptococcus]RLV26788.1 hypothetical protein DIX60_10505 [Streptococcus iniae]WMB28638.1 hypothetical protein N1496_03830 [Streptococcus didelphis]